MRHTFRPFAAVSLIFALCVAVAGCGVELPPPVDGDAAISQDTPAVVDAADVTDTRPADRAPDTAPAVDAAPGDAGVPPVDAAPDAAPAVDVAPDTTRDATPDAAPDAPGGDTPDATPADVPAPPLGRACTTGSDCPAFPGWTCGGDNLACRCTPRPVTPDPWACGTRDNDCDGVADPERECSGRCANIENDPRHCGGCGRACLAGEGCVRGTCVCESPGSTREMVCDRCTDRSVRGPESAFCTFCLTRCSAAARRTSQALNDCCNIACGIGVTPDPCR